MLRRFENKADNAPVSKRALKRQRKMDEWNSKTEERKKARKEKKIAKKEEKKKLVEQGIYKGDQKRRINPADQNPSPLKIIIDSDFESYMLDKEITSTAKQICRCYSANRQAKRPVDLIVTSLGPKVKKSLTDQQSTWVRWKGIQFHEDKSYVDVMEKKDDVIYLSADSENVLEVLDETKALVIGGIVDRNRHKNLCHDRATTAGLKTARLPISEYISLASRKILTVNHVFEIISKYLEHKDWKTAFWK
ncbi:guanine-1-methyltransferase-domain-containing protein [Chytridium lagenaria]|nr:guanine-1-methyltransferase-domain-containing protein [Chytridium lagenaria]